MSSNTWSRFCKAYAQEHLISYAAAIKEAGPAYQQWKQENEGKAQPTAPTVRAPAKKRAPPKKKTKVISSDSESEEERPLPKKRVVKKKRLPPKKKTYVSSDGDSSTLSESSDSDDYEYVSRKPYKPKKRVAKKKYYYE